MLCKGKIPGGIAAAVVLFVTLSQFSLSIFFLRLFVFTLGLLLVSFADLKERRIPNGCLLLLLFVWAATAPFSGELPAAIASHVIGAVVLAGLLLALALIMDRLLKKDSLGGGDIKLVGVITLYLGPTETLFALLAACIFGLLLAGLMKIFTAKDSRPFPFGPALALGGWGMMVYGGFFVEWYTNIGGM